MIRELWRRKWALAVVAVVALVFALLTTYQLPSFQKRSLQFGSATSQILVDSPQSTLVTGAQDNQLATLATRAQIFAQYLSSPEAQAKIAAATGVPASQLTASGPFSPDAQRQNYDPQQPTQRTSSISSEHAGNRLVFAAQQDVPIITVSVQSSRSAAVATKLANASFATLRTYVTALNGAVKDDRPARDASGQPLAANGVTVRQLGAPEAGTIGGGNSKLLMILAFVAVFGVGCAVILVAPSMARHWRLLDEIDHLESSASRGSQPSPAEAASPAETDWFGEHADVPNGAQDDATPAQRDPNSRARARATARS